MTRNLLITGGCGFIGARLIAHLADEDIAITVFDNESGGTADRLTPFPRVRFINGDVRNAAAVDAAVDGQDMIVHLAAQTDVITSVDAPEEDFDVNVAGGMNVLNAAVRHKVDRFVLASSAAPLGEIPPPVNEDAAPAPLSPYGAAKLAMEGYCSAYHASYGLKTASLRFSNVYGVGSLHKSSVDVLFIKRIFNGEPLTVFGDGEQTRDFIFVDDLCTMIQPLLAPDADADVFGKVYQLGTGVETSVNTLIGLLQALAAETGRAVAVDHALARDGEIVRNYADISRYLNTFGVKPTTVLADGLRQTWDYFLSQV